VFERFTEPARQVVVNAQDEARELGHARVGPEHELLGLLAEPDSDGSEALNSLGVTADRVRERVLAIVPRGDQRSVSSLPFTPESKKVLELALREALGLGHPDIAPGHVLLGLVHDREGVALHVLVSLGADQAATARQLRRCCPSRGRRGRRSSLERPGPSLGSSLLTRSYVGC